MKQTLPYKIWMIAYPLGIYYVVATITMFIAEFLLGSGNEKYMLCQIIASGVTIPFVYRFYRQDQMQWGIDKPDPWISKEHITNTLMIIPIAALIAVGLNNVIQMSPLITMSSSYQEASNAFYGSTFALELLGSACITPLLEELLYRGIIFGRLRKLVGVIPSILISSFIFAFMHFNLVQFIYAFLLGIVLALCMEHCGHMYGAVVAHITANGIAVIRTETGILQNTTDKSTFAITVSIVTLVVGIILLVWYLKGMKTKETA